MYPKCPTQLNSTQLNALEASGRDGRVRRVDVIRGTAEVLWDIAKPASWFPFKALSVDRHVAEEAERAEAAAKSTARSIALEKRNAERERAQAAAAAAEAKPKQSIEEAGQLGAVIKRRIRLAAGAPPLGDR